jgi:hypothetical protein
MQDQDRDDIRRRDTPLAPALREKQERQKVRAAAARSCAEVCADLGRDQ